MKPATSFDEFYRQIRLRKVAFFVTFFAIILISYGILYVVDFIPEAPGHDEEKAVVLVDIPEKLLEKEVTAPTPLPEETKAPVATVDALPTKIIIDKLDKEITILNPTEATIPAMDAALLKGVVRHPDSADFKKVGNIFLLGHSSYIPNVLNKNFQAFNGIQKLTWGDKIRIQSGDTEYVYRVETVRQESATEAIVPFTWGEANLTLVTCNSFGAKEDRFIVVAKLVDSYPILAK